MKNSKAAKPKATDETPWCCRCHEEFPLADKDQSGIRMGQLYPAEKFHKPFRNKIDGDYLCGNCYFDLTDE